MQLELLNLLLTHLGKGCHLIDVGINRLEDGSIVGDLDYDALRNHQFCASITPVPGVGR